MTTFSTLSAIGIAALVAGTLTLALPGGEALAQSRASLNAGQTTQREFQYPHGVEQLAAGNRDFATSATEEGERLARAIFATAFLVRLDNHCDFLSAEQYNPLFKRYEQLAATIRDNERGREGDFGRALRIGIQDADVFVDRIGCKSDTGRRALRGMRGLFGLAI